MHLPAEKSSSQDDERHRYQDKKRQTNINIGHEADGGGAQENGIVQRDHAHPGCHAYLLDVIGCPCHEITGLGFVEIGGREGFYMGKKLVAKAFLDASGCPQETTTPQVAEKAYGNTDTANISGVNHQTVYIDLKRRQVVDDSLDNSWHKEL